MQRVLTAIGACGLAMSVHAGPIERCPSDLSGDGTVSGFDLAFLLAAWGPCPEVESCPADLDGSGTVNGIDLDVLLGDWGFCPGVAATVTELAGNSLSAYPFFEYVRAFNQGSEIEIAIDQTRFPFIAGKTCDIYIVAKKTAVQWEADPSLTDVTGGFQTESFVAGVIQDNTFTVSGSSTLNGTTGTQIGIGYDMVCDCDQNGFLGTSDYIDGLSDEAGLYVVRDTEASGPYGTVELNYDIPNWTTAPPAGWGGPAGYQNENIFYPSNIASLGQVPLIVVSRGNGHNHNWYDHIGNHMTSYGYVVMSHNNQTEPPTGVPFASTTTLLHTDAFIANLPLISGGAMDGHVDTDQIVWLGHSRGGEGVAVAYDRLFDGTFTPLNYSIDDIKLVSSIAPVDFSGPGTAATATANPHNANYHLWTGIADADVNGCASSDVAQTFHLHERGTAYRQSISLHGVGHGDFHNGPTGSVASGPCLVGRPRTHEIMRGYFLPLVKRYLESDIPSKDFLTRQWESFKPIGAPATLACLPPSGSGVNVNVDLMYRDGPSAGNFTIDDYIVNPAMGTSSSGGMVTFNVTNLGEGRNDDINTVFTWVAGETMNGMTLARAADISFGVVFDYNSASFYEQEIIAAAQDFTQYQYLSFRACQGTRHPNTIIALEDLTFDVALRDSSGNTSTINIGAYGGGIEEPYMRTTCGVGAGWANEFETIRIRLTDFQNNGASIDLTDIVAVRFEFGNSGASLTGRVGLNEIQLTTD